MIIFFPHFLAFDLKSLEGIKDDKPYTSTEEYLDINYRLLREECFRDLCSGIQNFRETKSYDPRKMNMYRYRLFNELHRMSAIYLLKQFGWVMMNCKSNNNFSVNSDYLTNCTEYQQYIY